MNNDKIKEILYIAAAIIIAALAIKIALWLLPIILILVVSGFIYLSIIKNKAYKRSEKKNYKRPIKEVFESKEDNKK